MSATWVVSDPHFGHRLLVEGVDPATGAKLRPFTTVEDMNTELVARWNAVVAPNDRVYVLGDVAINRRYLAVVGDCHGRKVLVKGNHDIFKLKDYVPYFDDVRAYKVLDSRQAILSHIPLHPGSLGRFGFNIHGHLHHNVVRREDGTPDPRYASACVEHWNYAPVLLDTLLTLRPDTAP
jgi:calcineurin-like phosphoesterase family protein